MKIFVLDHLVVFSGGSQDMGDQLLVPKEPATEKIIHDKDLLVYINI